MSIDKISSPLLLKEIKTEDDWSNGSASHSLELTPIPTFSHAELNGDVMKDLILQNTKKEPGHWVSETNAVLGCAQFEDPEDMVGNITFPVTVDPEVSQELASFRQFHHSAPLLDESPYDTAIALVSPTVQFGTSVLACDQSSILKSGEIGKQTVSVPKIEESPEGKSKITQELVSSLPASEIEWKPIFKSVKSEIDNASSEEENRYDNCEEPFLDDHKPFSSNVEETFRKKCFDLGIESRVYYDRNSIRLIDVSVKLEDIFFKNARKPSKAHWNNESSAYEYYQDVYNSKVGKNKTSFVNLAKSRSERPFISKSDAVFSCKNTNSKSKNEMLTSNKRRFRCDLCTSIFKLKQHLQKHMLLHNDDKPFSCSLCPAKFKRSDNLKSHMIRHSEVRPFECSLCHKRFKTKSTLRQHLKWHTVVKPPKIRSKPKCQVCSIVCKDNKQLKVHTRIHTDERPYNCSICSAAFRQFGALQAHERSHSNKGSFCCDMCSTGFKTKARLSTHIIAVHLKERPFHCDVCSATFTQKARIKIHKQIYHSEERPYKCNLCPATFKKKGGLNTHMPTHSENKPYKCEHCSSCFKAQRNWKEHQIMHTGERPFVCNICSSSFRFRSNWRDHQRTHSTETPFKCEFCTRRFKTAKSLKCHLVTHNDEKPFQCELCSAVFKVRRSLTSHIVTHSEARPFNCDLCPASFKRKCILKSHCKWCHSNNDERPFECKLCPSKFKRKELLKRHLKEVHSTERPFKCSLCPLAFKQRKAIKIHMRAHTGEKPYKCDLCPATFQQSGGVKSHLQNVHSNERPFKCELCPLWFKSAKAVRGHAVVHSAARPYNCEQCPKAFKSSRTLRDHMIVHVYEKCSFRCTLCPSRFVEASQRDAHILEKHQGKRYTCAYCLGTFNWKQNLAFHIQKNHVEATVQR